MSSSLTTTTTTISSPQTPLRPVTADEIPSSFDLIEPSSSSSSIPPLPLSTSSPPPITDTTAPTNTTDSTSSSPLSSTNNTDIFHHPLRKRSYSIQSPSSLSSITRPNNSNIVRNSMYSTSNNSSSSRMLRLDLAEDLALHKIQEHQRRKQSLTGGALPLLDQQVDIGPQGFYPSNSSSSLASLRNSYAVSAAITGTNLPRNLSQISLGGIGDQSVVVGGASANGLIGSDVILDDDLSYSRIFHKSSQFYRVSSITSLQSMNTREVVDSSFTMQNSMPFQVPGAGLETSKSSPMMTILDEDDKNVNDSKQQGDFLMDNSADKYPSIVTTSEKNVNTNNGSNIGEKRVHTSENYESLPAKITQSNYSKNHHLNDHHQSYLSDDMISMANNVPNSTTASHCDTDEHQQHFHQLSNDNQLQNSTLPPAASSLTVTPPSNINNTENKNTNGSSNILARFAALKLKRNSTGSLYTKNSTIASNYSNLQNNSVSPVPFNVRNGSTKSILKSYSSYLSEMDEEKSITTCRDDPIFDRAVGFKNVVQVLESPTLYQGRSRKWFRINYWLSSIIAHSIFILIFSILFLVFLGLFISGMTIKSATDKCLSTSYMKFIVLSDSLNCLVFLIFFILLMAFKCWKQRREYHSKKEKSSTDNNTVQSDSNVNNTNNHSNTTRVHTKNKFEHQDSISLFKKKQLFKKSLEENAINGNYNTFKNNELIEKGFTIRYETLKDEINYSNELLNYDSNLLNNNTNSNSIYQLNNSTNNLSNTQSNDNLFLIKSVNSNVIANNHSAAVTGPTTMTTFSRSSSQFNPSVIDNSISFQIPSSSYSAGSNLLQNNNKIVKSQNSFYYNNNILNKQQQFVDGNSVPSVAASSAVVEDQSPNYLLYVSIIFWIVLHIWGLVSIISVIDVPADCLNGIGLLLFIPNLIYCVLMVVFIVVQIVLLVLNLKK